MDILDVVLPIFLVVGLGYGLRRAGFLDPVGNAAVSRLVFYVAAPALLARATAGNSLDETFNAPAMCVVAGATILVGAGVYVVCRRCSPRRRGVVAQGSFRSNQVFVGLPIIIYAYGEASVNAVAVLVSFTVILYNFQSVVLLVLPQQSPSVSRTTLMARTAISVLKNPLNLACLCGILYSLTGWTLPVVLDRGLELVGRTAAPLALLSVGAGLEFSRLRNDIVPAVLVSLVKTLLYPALGYVALGALGMSGLDLKLPVIIMAAPTAVVSYIMARELGGDERLAGAIVIGSTLLSLLTIIGWLVVLGPGG